MSNSLISVIIPAYNEEQAIIKVISEVAGVMDNSGRNYEIIVVDDCSRDRTAELVKTEKVRLLRHNQRRGVGAARKTGISNARGDIVVMIDADGTYPAQSIPSLLALMPRFDQVIGSRTKDFGRLKTLRMWVKRSVFSFASFCAGQQIPDLNSGLRAIKKEVLSRYLSFVPDGFSCVSTMTLSFMYNGYAVTWIPIDYYPRIGRSKFRRFRDTLWIIFAIIRLRLIFKRTRRP
ncbi:MAG: glycosyltransferase family 2 protein [Candidatus Omnitrophica bacterium]|nr:glycosyltransferase family 2 protein [Candidatus Omnitrophota bacterium]